MEPPWTLDSRRASSPDMWLNFSWATFLGFHACLRAASHHTESSPWTQLTRMCRLQYASRHYSAISREVYLSRWDWTSVLRLLFSKRLKSTRHWGWISGSAKYGAAGQCHGRDVGCEWPQTGRTTIGARLRILSTDVELRDEPDCLVTSTR